MAKNPSKSSELDKVIRTFSRQVRSLRNTIPTAQLLGSYGNAFNATIISLSMIGSYTSNSTRPRNLGGLVAEAHESMSTRCRWYQALRLYIGIDIAIRVKFIRHPLTWRRGLRHGAWEQGLQNSFKCESLD